LNGRLLAAQGKATAALGLLQPLAARNPNQKELVLEVCRLFGQLNKPYEGLQFFAPIVERNKAYPPFWVALAAFQTKLNRFSEARESLTLALDHAFTPAEQARIKTTMAENDSFEQAFDAEQYRNSALAPTP
jgi:predicted Zn-dependent protease